MTMERDGLCDKMTTLLDAAEAGGRPLSRTEKTAYSRLETRAAELGDALADLRDEHDFWNERAPGQPDLRGACDLSRDLGAERTCVLAPEQWATDYVRAAGGFMPDEHVRPGATGRLIGALVAGERHGLSEYEERVLSIGVQSAGGFLLPAPLSATVIDRVRNAMRVVQAGAQTVMMEVETLALARLTGGATPTPAWKVENDPISTSDMTFDRVELKAKTLPILAKMSRELFDDLSPGASQTIENELSKAIALELDRVCLYGSGVDPEPRGLVNQSGVTLVSLGANGASLADYVPFVDGISAVRDANHDPGAFVYSSRTQKSVDLLVDSTGQPLRAPASVEALPKLVSNQVPNDETVGTSVDCSSVFTGAWGNLLIGLRTELPIQVKVLQERYADELQVGLLMFLRADVAVAHGEAFAVVQGVRP